MAYILGRNERRYELKSLSRRQKIELSNLMKNDNREGFEKIENVFYTILKFSYPELNKEEFEDILDYNDECYGFEETYEMINYLIEDVFMSVGGKKPNPYLEAKREQHKKQEQERMNGVAEVL